MDVLAECILGGLTTCKCINCIDQGMGYALKRFVCIGITGEGIARVEAAFIDQSPQLNAVEGFGAKALCLPFFAANGDHVTRDIPQALAIAGFAGRILPPLGLDRRVPALIAQAITAGRAVCAGECRYLRA